MEQTTTEITIAYIKEHPYIKSCLKKGLLNYSSLARLISSELKIEKKTSKEAILVAARRFEEKLKGELSQEWKIRQILSASELEIKNKIIAFIIEKNVNFEFIEEIQKKIRHDSGTFFLLEGSTTYTIISQEKYAILIKEKINSRIISCNKDLALINLKSNKDVVHQPGVIAYLTSLFAENMVNITDLFSCWTDNLFVIAAQDVPKAMNFLNFR